MFFKVNFYFLFIFILGYLGGGVFSPYAYAATVITANHQEATLNIEQKKALSKKNQSTYHFINSDSLYYPPSAILYSIVTQRPSPVTVKGAPLQKPSQKKNGNKINLFPNLYTQTKGFLIQNKDNEVVQSSLLVFGQTRQFLKETDLMLHNLTQNILLSLNLDSPNLKGLLVLPQDEISMSTRTTNTDYKQQIEITKLQSLSQQQNQQKSGYSDNELFALIFNLQNLFYLAGVFICFLIVKQLIKFALIKDKFDSQNRR